MQDGGNERPRPGAASALDDVRARSAERFGRKSASETGETQALGNEPSQSAPENSGIESAERPDPAPAEPPATPTEDSQDLSETKTETTEAADADLTSNMRPVEAEVRMSDGANYVGRIYIHEDERVLDYLNSAIPFFALTEISGKVRLLSKAQVMQIVPYDKGDVNAAALRGGGSLM